MRAVTRWRIPGAKITVPAPPGIFVPRPRLGALFDPAGARPVTVVCAPAGSGKTALLAHWARGSRAVAWVSLDNDDNDETRFWAAVLCALRRCPAVPAESPLHRLAPPAPGERADFLAELGDAVAGPIWLVLDDFHEIVHEEPVAGSTVPVGQMLKIVTDFVAVATPDGGALVLLTPADDRSLPSSLVTVTPNFALGGSVSLPRPGDVWGMHALPGRLSRSPATSDLSRRAARWPPAALPACPPRSIP